MNIAMRAQISSRTGSFLSTKFSKSINAMRAHAKRRKEVRSLRTLDDRILRDMGFDRSEIISIVHTDQHERRVQHARD